MAIGKTRKNGNTEIPVQRARPIASEHAADVQRKARELYESRLKTGRQTRTEHAMAALRSEAMRARRLAEQIESLSRQPENTKRNRMMKQPAAIDVSQTPLSERRSAKNGSSGHTQLSFNPLHPSKELPPEQLIRLLGVETKKIRSTNKSKAAPAKPGTATNNNVMDQAIIAAPLLSPARPVRVSDHGHRASTVTGHSRLIKTLIAIAVFAAIAIAAYFFVVPQPADKTAKIIQPAVSAPSANTAGPAVNPGALVPPAKHQSQAAANRAPAQPASATRPDAERQNAITAELLRLKKEAEQRFTQRLSAVAVQQELAPRPASVPNPPTDEHPVTSEMDEPIGDEILDLPPPQEAGDITSQPDLAIEPNTADTSADMETPANQNVEEPALP